VSGHSIELATEADMARILEISNWAAVHTTANFAYAPEPLEEWQATYRHTRELHAWLVARDAAGQVVGWAKSGPHRARAAYAWCAEVSVYIDPAFHRRGVGRALYEVLFQILGAQGFVTLLAGITVGHHASEALHASFGFTRCAIFHRCGWKMGAWQGVSYWEKHLQPDDYVPQPTRPVREVYPLAQAAAARTG
jgi:phosphinothricin acetyltransferase